MPYGKKTGTKSQAKKVFKTCKGCPSPARCKAAGKCMKKARK